MKHAELKITTSGDRELVMTRVFDAPCRLVFDAHTKPELVQRWLLGPPGWSMPVCEMDVRVGGTYRWVWRNDSDGTEMGMGGTYREVRAPEPGTLGRRSIPSPSSSRSAGPRSRKRCATSRARRATGS